MNTIAKLFLSGTLPFFAAASLVSADPSIDNTMGVDTRDKSGEEAGSQKDSAEALTSMSSDSSNGDIDLIDYGLDRRDFPGTALWEIDSDGKDYSQVFGPTGALTIFTEENQIFDAFGTLQCIAYEEGGLFKLRHLGKDAVLLTASEIGYVFSGNVDVLPEPSTAEWQRLAESQLAYALTDDRLYKVRDGQAEIAGRTDVSLREANPMRTLLIGAIHEGICGVERAEMSSETDNVGDGSDFPGTFIWGGDSTQELRCQSERCRNRQRRRIFRAECRLEGGYAIGWTCRIPEGGN
ncbi:hypothetical protein [Thiorhodococcus minor]|uniref:WG repeat-containing protein n=1 Tax=Thiorhodococcus minor TaxID=57489 RepID=A0A6M0K6V6_9GAMM|nr:hypothetical protein [Thiorhodococcus minor]NEV65209.1 hypothetical protein [Thiorhodococcus minor]